MKQVRINVPLTVRHTVLIPLGSDMISKIEAEHNGVSVLISGMRDAVDGALSLGAPSDPHSLIQRALSALGYVVGDHEKDMAQFSRWVDRLAEFPQSEEALELWTKSVLALLPSVKSIEGASLDARDVVIQRMRLFPPAPKTGLGDGPLPEPWAELHEWRSAAKRCGIASVKELAGTVSETFGQFVDRKIVSEWQEATGCPDPATAKERIEQREQAWVNATDRHCPGDAEQRIDDLQMQTKMQAETIRAWRKETGAETPESAINRVGADQDAWKEATGCSNAFQAQKKLAELESKLLSYASEIDALRKAPQTHDPVVVAIEHGAHFALNGQIIGRVYDPERELAKVRAELQSKCREAQTEKERANTAEGMYQAERAKRESEVRAANRASNHLEDAIVEARKAAGIDHEKPGSGDYTSLAKWCSDARAKLASAIIPLPKPEKVEAGQKWARVARITSVGGWGVIERATMGSEQPTLTSLRNDNDWTYLGT